MLCSFLSILVPMPFLLLFHGISILCNIQDPLYLWYVCYARSHFHIVKPVNEVKKNIIKKMFTCANWLRVKLQSTIPWCTINMSSALFFLLKFVHTALASAACNYQYDEWFLYLGHIFTYADRTWRERDREI